MPRAEFRTVYVSATDGLELARIVVPSEGGTARVHHRLSFGQGRRGAVAIARRADGAILFTSSLRWAAGARLLELPRGLAEPVDDASDNVLVAAGIRELREETGFTASSPRLLGEIVVDSAVYPLKVGIVLCDVAGDTPVGPRDGEVDEVLWIAREGLSEMIVRGSIVDGLSLTALALLRAHEDAGTAE